MNSLGAQQQESSPPPPVTQKQRLAASHNDINIPNDMARLPRIPVMGNDGVPTMTLEELWDWKDRWHAKGRLPTASERLDYDESDRQINILDSDDAPHWQEFWEEFDRNEQEMDACPSPTQRNHPAWTKDYQLGRAIRKIEARIEQRKQRKRILSPPRTPPHLRGSGLYTHQQASAIPQGGSFRIKKGKHNNRKAPRRPITRSTATPNISLHDRKGYVKFWSTMTQYVVISYEKYLRDYDREELDKRPWEPMDFSREDPKRPHKTDYQREVCRRGMAQQKDSKNTVCIPWHSWKGNK